MKSLLSKRAKRALPAYGLVALTFLASHSWHCSGQDLLKKLPAYERYQKASRQQTNLSVTAPVFVWREEGKTVEWSKEGKRYRYDIATRTESVLGDSKSNAAPNRSREEGSAEGRARRGPAGRGRQVSSTTSPDGKLKASYRDRNLWLSESGGSNEVAITRDGNDTNRVKYGTASWVYGEELAQTSAMWWSPDSRKIAFYRFDESQVPDYYLTLHQTSLHDTVAREPYPKAGETNPVVDVLIYDVVSKKTVRVDVRDGEAWSDGVVGHYVYGISWSGDGRELIFHRTNRKQNVLELCAADPQSGTCRAILREAWPTSWVENSPTLRLLKDNKRFIWASERTGWKNYYLYELSGKLLATLTRHDFEVGDIQFVDEKAGVLFYMAHSGDNPLKLQLHRVNLDGSDNRRLTNPAFNHTINFAPDGRNFVDVAQTHDSPPVAHVMDAEGAALAELSRCDLVQFKKQGLRPVELLEFKAADGCTTLYGLLNFPSDFNPRKKYPLLVSVYAGPATSGARETFALPNAITELGFLVATFDSRSAPGRGKHFLDAIYKNFGQVEIDDQAAGVRALWKRPYLDKNRVGIFGTSYGGTASAMCLLRHPDVFQAACSCSAVTDFRNYDTIYTERYMGLPQENKAAYDAASLMTYAEKLHGRLLLYGGTADDNVHPSNLLQFIQALQRAGKNFEVQIGPDQGHGAVNRDRMMEFFVQHLGNTRLW